MASDASRGEPPCGNGHVPERTSGAGRVFVRRLEGVIAWARPRRSQPGGKRSPPDAALCWSVGPATCPCRRLCMDIVAYMTSRVKGRPGQLQDPKRVTVMDVGRRAFDGAQAARRAYFTIITLSLSKCERVMQLLFINSPFRSHGGAARVFHVDNAIGPDRLAGHEGARRIDSPKIYPSAWLK